MVVNIRVSIKSFEINVSIGGYSTQSRPLIKFSISATKYWQASPSLKYYNRPAQASRLKISPKL